MKRAWASLLAVLPAMFAFSQELPVLTYLTEEYPPLNYSEGGTVKGVSVEVLKAVWKAMGIPEQHISVLPWARGYDRIQKQDGIVLFAMTRSPARERLFKWVGPIFTERQVLVARPDWKGSVANLDEARKYTIGVVKDDISETILKSANFPPEKMEVAPKIEFNVSKLLAGRFDLLSISESALGVIVKDSKLNPADFRVVYVIQENPNYYTFSLGTPDEVIARFQRALASIRVEHEAIVRSYGMHM